MYQRDQEDMILIDSNLSQIKIEKYEFFIKF